MRTLRVPLIEQARGPTARFVAAFVNILRRDPFDQSLFWLFVVGLAWVPFWYGSNDWIAWGINAIIFPGLTVCYELSVLVRGRPHAVAIKSIAVPTALFVLVLLWIGGQTIAWANGWPANPVWALAGKTLGAPVVGSITVNRDLTIIALIRLITAASTFWLAMQLCRNDRRADLLNTCIGIIVAVYAGYGLIATKFGPLPWLPYISSRGYWVSSTFINPDSFATYAAIGLIVTVALLVRFYGEAIRVAAGTPKLQVAYLIERTGGRNALLLGLGLLILSALLLTASRGGIFAAGFGLFVLFILARRRLKQAKGSMWLFGAGAILIGATLVEFGGAVSVKLGQGGIYDESRFAVYVLTLRSIKNEPLLGFGYGTFPDVFPMYRDRSIGVLGTWTQAHNTYLELFQGLGLVFGTLLIGCMALLVVRCAKGAMNRQREVVAPGIAVGVASVVATHALVDFSLQIQAVSLTLTAILGAGVAQSASSRISLND